MVHIHFLFVTVTLEPKFIFYILTVIISLNSGHRSSINDHNLKMEMLSSLPFLFFMTVIHMILLTHTMMR